MNNPPLLVEVRNCLFPYFIAISKVYRQSSECFLGKFVDGGAVMFKNIKINLGECVAAVCACVF